MALVLVALIANSREFGWIFGFIGTAFLAVWAIIAGIANDLTAPSQTAEPPAENAADYAPSEHAMVKASDYLWSTLNRATVQK